MGHGWTFGINEHVFTYPDNLQRAPPPAHGTKAESAVVYRVTRGSSDQFSSHIGIWVGPESGPLRVPARNRDPMALRPSCIVCKYVPGLAHLALPAEFLHHDRWISVMEP
jgi:hypothetical protein